MKMPQKAGIILAAIAVVAGARFYLQRRPASAIAPAKIEAGATIPHMDHAPRHGGLVLMRGDTHFEVVLERDGRCQVFFSDASRADLPASFASEVDVGLASMNGERQSVPFTPDSRGKTWVGQVRMTTDSQAIVRVTYVAHGEPPYWIDVPLSAWRS